MLYLTAFEGMTSAKMKMIQKMKEMKTTPTLLCWSRLPPEVGSDFDSHELIDPCILQLGARRILWLSGHFLVYGR